MKPTLTIVPKPKSFKKESIHYNLFDVNNELFSMDGLMAAYLDTVDRCNKDKLKN
jgi:hypothetical protein